MVLKNLCTAIVLTAGPASADQTVFNEMLCLPTVQALNDLAAEYGEIPLFTGTVYLFATGNPNQPAQPTAGPVLFTVNQTTGSWSLFYAVSANTSCLLASGRDFIPE